MVMFGVTKLLPQGCWILRVDLPKLWIVYRYEWLQDLCFKCSLLVHGSKICKKERDIASLNLDLPKYDHGFSVQAPGPLASIQKNFQRRRMGRDDPSN